MATNAERQRPGASNAGRASRKKHFHQGVDSLKLLRLDVHTCMEQIQILDQELESDPCLTTDGVAIILSLVEALKQELESARLRILELTPAD